MPRQRKTFKYGMVIDLDRCTGCGACMVACAVENNVPPAAANATPRTGITWMRVFRVNNGAKFEQNRTAFIPVLCQQCGKEPPCASVCPQNAVELDPATGIVYQMPQRCLGCRYCMAACAYHARYFNWWDPAWPPGMEKALNPDIAPRMRGVVEKCNSCHGRYHAAKLEGGEYVPACAEACPAGAITFGDLNGPGSDVARMAAAPEAFRILEQLGTDPKVHYRTARPWVRALAEKPLTRNEGAHRG